MTSKMGYRPDIDGLRAVAVLAVLFYHAGLSPFSGGYVGVDVFFVISGYLITTIIVREIETGEFSIVKFYERRIRRIYPALYVVLLVTLAVGIFLYAPDNFMALGKSTLATTLFTSNILFWSEEGYFNTLSTLKPLLHTWSLAVEEQFYIVFPLLVVAIMRLSKRSLKPLLSILALASFGLSVYYVRQDAATVFYLAPFRAWELLTGSLLAINILPTNLHPKLRNLLSIGGLALILTSVVWYTDSTLFPGESALLPVLGAAFIIYSGMAGDTMVGKLLKTPWLVFIGKISYSLYLWHWVIIVFGKYYAILPPTPVDILSWLALSFALATLSWKYIESPFRDPKIFDRQKIYLVGGSIMALTFMLGGIIYYKEGFPSRFNGAELAIFSSPADRQDWHKWSDCRTRRMQGTDDLVMCKIGVETKPHADFLLWGDSHARVVASAMNNNAGKHNLMGELATSNSCPPLLETDRTKQITCIQFNQMIFEYIKAHPEIKTIILSARWGIYTNGKKYKLENGSGDISSSPGAAKISPEMVKARLEKTVGGLIALHKNVFIVSAIPEIGYDVPSAQFIALRTGRDINAVIAPTLDEYLARNKDVIAILAEVKKMKNVHIIDPASLLCDQQICKVAVDGQALYKDDNHLSPFGSRYIASLFDVIFAQIQAVR